MSNAYVLAHLGEDDNTVRPLVEKALYYLGMAYGFLRAEKSLLERLGEKDKKLEKMIEVAFNIYMRLYSNMNKDLTEYLRNGEFVVGENIIIPDEEKYKKSCGQGYADPFSFAYTFGIFEITLERIYNKVLSDNEISKIRNYVEREFNPDKQALENFIAFWERESKKF